MMFYILTFLIRSSFAYETSCFNLHLDDAIQINESRKDLYGEITESESDWIVDKLIRQQKFGKYYAYYFDWRAEKYQKNGISLLCDEFVSMEFTPPFTPFVEPKVKLTQLPEFPLRDWKEGLSNADEFYEIEQRSLRFVRTLNELPDYYCMTRHLLSSIARSARLAPSHIEKSLIANLASPQGLLLDFIRFQVDALQDAYELDRIAFPLQAKGIPILCRDVPEIPFN